MKKSINIGLLNTIGRLLFVSYGKPLPMAYIKTYSWLYASFFLFAGVNPDFYQKLSGAAIELTNQRVQYDPQYFKIAYPNGDVPAGKGVCTDVVIRAYRKLGIDLQKLVHEDMRQNFTAYPKMWGLRNTDRNIDHRRVPNLMTFFKRKGASLPITQNAKDYLPGDIVCWNLNGGLTHIGIVVARKSTDGRRNMIVHNIGSGQVLADCLFSYKIIGHYRYGG